MQIKEALDEKLLDSRLRDRLLAEGKLSEEQLKKYLQSLEDDSNKLKTTKLDQ